MAKIDRVDRASTEASSASRAVELKDEIHKKLAGQRYLHRSQPCPGHTRQRFTNRGCALGRN